MAYTPERSWATGDTISASDLNTYLRDNVDFVKAAVDGVAFTGCKLSRSTAQSIANMTDTLISFDTESFDFGGWFGGSGTTVTVPASAIPSGYTTIALLIVARSRFAINATGARIIRILKNGTAEDGTSVGGLPSDVTDVNSVAFVTAVSGDTIQLQVYQSSGGSLNADVNKLSVVRYAPVS